jgi:hypothetical protein
MIKSKIMRWARPAEQMGQVRNAYKILAEKYDEQRPLKRARHISEDNIKCKVVPVLFFKLSTTP